KLHPFLTALGLLVVAGVTVRWLLFDALRLVDVFPKDIIERNERPAHAMGTSLQAEGYRFIGPDWTRGTDLDKPYAIGRGAHSFKSVDPIGIFDLTDDYIVV